MSKEIYLRIKWCAHRFVFRTLLKQNRFFPGDLVKLIDHRFKLINGLVKRIDHGDNTIFVSWTKNSSNWYDPKNLALMNNIEFPIVDYVYCEDCFRYVCLGKLDTIQDTKHKNHTIRKISQKEYSLLEKNKLKLE